MSIKTFVFSIAVVSASLGSIQAQKTVKFDIEDSQARVLDVAPSTYVKPVIAEIAVDTSKGRIRDVWTLTPDELDSRTIKDDDNATMQNLRTYAVFKSSEKHQCDVVIAATFNVHISERGAEITIVGYPANFCNWQTGTIADYEWIKNEPNQLRNTHTAVDGDSDNKNKK